MANFIDVENLTYCGKEAGGIFSKDVYGLELRSYGITFMDAVKGKTKIYTGEIGDDIWQKYTCPFSPKGDVTLDEAFIEPAEIKVNLEECFDKFWNTFLVEQTSITLAGGIPQTFSNWFFAKLREKMSADYQKVFWQGDTAKGEASYLGVIDGVEKQLKNSKAEQVTGSKVTLDNIIAQVEGVILKGLEKAAETDTPTEGYKVFVNYADYKTLQVALGKLCCGISKDAIFGNYAKNGDRITVMGYDVIPTMQTPSTIIFGPARNLVLGFDTYSSHLEYKLIDMRQTTGDNMFRVIALSNIAVGIVLPELFVYSSVA